MGNYNRFIFTAEFLTIWLPRTTKLTEVGNWKRQYKLRNIPHDLDLNPYFTHGKKFPEDFTRYKLHAVLTHFGQSMDSGHYIAAVLDTTSGTWFKFDDDRVTKLVDFQREVGDDAYMLLYRNLAQGDLIKGNEKDSEERREQTKGNERGSAEMVMNGRAKSSKEEKGEAQNAGKKDYRQKYVHQSQNTSTTGVQEFMFLVGERKITIPIKNISE
ncbi:hypothetical protein SUGI_0012510 [Cryptomeria japonica]|nr:hypothetical protein SUGI_0012510 [Cryptomeria japonica]